MSFTFSPAVRSAMKPLIGLFGKSGGGKTLSALYLARGLAGPNGKVGLVDTENKRGLAFTGMVDFHHVDFQPPFAPLRYCEAMDAAQEQGIDALVIDSASHEWLGEGGYLDMKEAELKRMAGDDWSKREKCAMAAAARIKPMNHGRFVQKILRCPMAVILCFRAHDKVKLDKVNGQTKIITEETPSPMQDGDLIYEMLIAGEVYSKEGIGGFYRSNGPHCKHTHPDILKLLPKDGEQISTRHGEQLARWCAAAGASNDTQQPGTAVTGTAKQPEGILTPKQLREKLWGMIPKDQRGGGNWLKANDYLRKRALIGDNEDAATFTAEQLISVIDRMNDNIP